MAFSFQTADRFFADIESWVPVGAVTADRGDEDTFVLRLQDGPMTIRLSFCGPECLRVRFDPEGETAAAIRRTRLSIGIWRR